MLTSVGTGVVRAGAEGKRDGKAKVDGLAWLMTELT